MKELKEAFQAAAKASKTRRQEGKKARRQDLAGVPLTLELSFGKIGSGRGKYTLRRGEFSAILSARCFLLFFYGVLLI